jgi:hypothetical protein
LEEGIRESDIQMDNGRISLVLCGKEQIQRYFLFSRAHHVPLNGYVSLKKWGGVGKEEKGIGLYPGRFGRGAYAEHPDAFDTLKETC